LLFHEPGLWLWPSSLSAAFHPRQNILSFAGRGISALFVVRRVLPAYSGNHAG
jgi:hypothetical protein